MSQDTSQTTGLLRARRDDLSTREPQRKRTEQPISSSTTTRHAPPARKQQSLQSMLAGTKHAPSTRALTEDGTVNITYNGYWWGSPVQISLHEEPFTVRPMVGLTPPNGRATITREYDQYGLWDVKTSYTTTEKGVETTRGIRQNEPDTAVATTHGTSRVGARQGRSRPVLFMTNFTGQIESEITDHDLCMFSADVYIEALGDWDSETGSTKLHRYERDRKDKL